MSVVSTHGELTVSVAVARKTVVADRVVELELAAVDGADLPTWEPGAHIDLHLAKGLSRQYSLMAGNEGSWRIAVLIQEQGRGGSLYIRDQLDVGDQLEVVGPRNHFQLSTAPKYLFVAGGIGVTPLIPMINKLEQRGANWELVYLGRSISTMAYAAELRDTFGHKVRLVPKDSLGRFDLIDFLGSIDPATHVYSCGPERLLLSIEDGLGEVGAHRVHVERFHPREVVSDIPDHEFTVYCKKSDVEIVVADDESILMAADFAGVDIPGDCMEGTCGACETRVFEGDVDHRDSILTPQARAIGDTMMICVSRSKGNRLVIDL